MTTMERRLDGNAVKRRNKEAAFRVVQRQSPVSRSDIAARIGVSPATAATLVDEMLESGIATESKDARGFIGRTPRLVSLIADARLCVAFDLASSVELSFAAIGLDGKPVLQGSELRDPQRDYGHQLRRFIATARERVRAAGHEDRIIGYGASVPGPYLAASDRVVCKRVRDMDDVHVGRLFQDTIGALPVIDEDVKLAADASIGMIPGASEALYVYLGEGVGGAYSLHDGIHSGAAGFAGDIGQMRLSPAECVEDRISWGAFCRGIADASSAGSLDEAAAALARRATDPVVAARLEETASVLAMALSNAAWLLNPAIIVVDGYARAFGDSFLAAVTRSMAAWLMPGMAPRISYAPTLPGVRGSLVGVANRIQKTWLASTPARSAAVSREQAYP
jgi:predicted NBD/HSP70 family sugar kinase